MIISYCNLAGILLYFLPLPWSFHGCFDSFRRRLPSRIKHIRVTTLLFSVLVLFQRVTLITGSSWLVYMAMDSLKVLLSDLGLVFLLINTVTESQESFDSNELVLLVSRFGDFGTIICCVGQSAMMILRVSVLKLDILRLNVLRLWYTIAFYGVCTGFLMIALQKTNRKAHKNARLEAMRQTWKILCGILLISMAFDMFLGVMQFVNVSEPQVITDILEYSMLPGEACAMQCQKSIFSVLVTLGFYVHARRATNLVLNKYEHSVSADVKVYVQA
eukprot:959732_1